MAVCALGGLDKCEESGNDGRGYWYSRPRGCDSLVRAASTLVVRLRVCKGNRERDHARRSSA